MNAATVADRLLAPGFAEPPGVTVHVTLSPPPHPLFPLHREIVRETLPTGEVEEYAVHADHRGVCSECGTVLALTEFYFGPPVRHDDDAARPTPPIWLPVNTTATWMGRRDAHGAPVSRTFTGPRSGALRRLNRRRPDPVRAALDHVAEQLESYGEEVKRAEWIARAAAKAGLARLATYDGLCRAAVVIAARERSRYLSLDEVADRPNLCAGTLKGGANGKGTRCECRARYARTTWVQPPPDDAEDPAPTCDACAHPLTLHPGSPSRLRRVPIGTVIARVRGAIGVAPTYLTATEVLRSVTRRVGGFTEEEVRASTGIVEHFEVTHPRRTRRPAVIAAGAMYVVARRGIPFGRPSLPGRSQPALAAAFGVTEVSVRVAAKELEAGRDGEGR